MIFDTPKLPYNRAEFQDKPPIWCTTEAKRKAKEYKDKKAGVKPKAFSWDDVEFKYRMPVHLR